ncbi:hypothetical protein [Bradyrhizobium guangdongense]|uniref:Uncharacterized protein n=1 Tax=Bradyrhizobium guangdongense TaxID=1325090 RepID=A0A410V044_9BRAD|nr:hypothetical protein [Bradyrhizobium guangdongense]QAU37044.1 hypothetical protein X265_04565 [Bradyrhizobium guangdongense]QOZ58099.1 hypothetical protein XH86_04565 [Bradyrhizobium guangdongense]GGI32805.1 hypothetical protein GCM10010987_71250 [Bradyrhizobium guangdongense]
MIGAIELLRKKADECERRAKRAIDKSDQAELMDMCAELHWLSGEAARLQSRITLLEASEPFVTDCRVTQTSAPLEARTP